MKTPQAMKAAFISDVHLGPSSTYKGVRRKLTEHSESFISEFVQHITENPQYSFAIQLGDLIQHANRQTDLKHLQKAVNLISRCPCPFYHLVGNHDTIYLTPSQVRDVFGYQKLYYSFDVSGTHVIILYSHVPVAGQPPILIQGKQLAWLRSDLAMTDKPTVVFVHHSLADQDLTGNPWFEGLPSNCLIENREEVREVLANSGRVIAVVNGHLHWNRIDVHDGIPYITVQSAVESLVEKGVPSNSWGMVEIDNTIFRIEVFGNDSAAFEYDFSQTKNGDVNIVECAGFRIET